MNCFKANTSQSISKAAKNQAFITRFLFCSTLLFTFEALPQALRVATVGPRASALTFDGTNANARFLQPSGIAMDIAGNVYIADSGAHTVRKMSSLGENWVTTTIAGLPGAIGSSDGTNSDARFYGPSGIAVDYQSNLYVCDTHNHTIRKITPSGTNWIVSTIAGAAGIVFPYGADGLGNVARFLSPQGIAVDLNGVIYVSDTGNNTIRMLIQFGPYARAWTIAGSPGDGGAPGVGAGAADGFGSYASFYNPAGIAMVSQDVFMIADSGNNTVRKLERIGSDWFVSTAAGLAGASGSSDGTGTLAQFAFPTYLSVDTTGEIFVSDTGNNTIRKMTLVGFDWTVETIAGLPDATGANDGFGSAARFNAPFGTAVDAAGVLYIADHNNGTIRGLENLQTNWMASTIAGARPTAFGQIFNVASFGGNLYFPDYDYHVIRRLSPSNDVWVADIIAGSSGTPGTSDGTNNRAKFNNPTGITVDSETNLYIADYGNYTIRRVAPVGTNWVVTTMAGTPGIAAAGADGTNSNARFWHPQALTIDPGGALYIADNGNNAIRMLQQYGTNSVVTTIAGVASIFSTGSSDGTNNDARFAFPSGITMDSNTNLFVADTGGSLIRKITHVGTNWVVTTITGVSRLTGSVDGVGAQALFKNPCGIGADQLGRLYVADTYNHTLRMLIPIDTNWVVTTVAGRPAQAGTLDGVGVQSRFNAPQGLCVTSQGTIFVADTGNRLIRRADTVPVLNIAVFGPNAVLSWNAAATNYMLESNADLLVGSPWVPISGAPALLSGQFVVTNPMSRASMFFRLRNKFE